MSPAFTSLANVAFELPVVCVAVRRWKMLWLACKQPSNIQLAENPIRIIVQQQSGTGIGGIIRVYSAQFANYQL